MTSLRSLVKRTRELKGKSNNIALVSSIGIEKVIFYNLKMQHVYSCDWKWYCGMRSIPTCLYTVLVHNSPSMIIHTNTSCQKIAACRYRQLVLSSMFSSPTLVAAACLL
jgi:hypothetical protein